MPITVRLISHTRTGKPFTHRVRTEPLHDSTGHVQCFQITSTHVAMLTAGAAAAAAAAKMSAPSRRKSPPDCDGDHGSINYGSHIPRWLRPKEFGHDTMLLEEETRLCEASASGER